MSGENVLIVEDEGIEALDLQHRLVSLGYTVSDPACTGEEAVVMAGEIRPDLVLMDIMLAGEIDGVVAAEKIQTQLDIPIIYLSAYADEATLQRAKITEPYGYIVKPFRERELRITIDMALYKHKMERRLKENEKWLATTLRSIGDAVIATDKNGMITFMNPVAETLMGWKLEEILKRKLTEVFKIVNRNTREPVENPVERVLLEGKVVGLANHTVLINRNEKEVPIDDSAAPIKDDKGNLLGVVLVFRDVTEREKTEEALLKARDQLEMRVQERTAELAKINAELQVEIDERMRAEKAVESERQRLYHVLETLPVYVVLMTPDHHVPFANRFFRERFGESHGMRCFEYLFGRTEPCEVCETFTVLKTNAPHNWEWTGPDGRNYDIFDFPFTETDGSLRIMEMGIDISERKKAEKQSRSYMEKLEQSNRDLQDFAYVACHDLQEPARKIQTFAGMLSMMHQERVDDKARDYLERIRGSAERMQDLVLDLLKYSRLISDPAPFTLFNLKAPAEDAVTDLGMLFEETGGGIEIGKLPDVKADKVQMRQLFQNLFANSLRYRSEQQPFIRVYDQSSGSGKFWEIHVKDNGVGFDECYMDKIFKPFQRLYGKCARYPGNGMGLAICRRIVERHEGSITAKSKPGQGSTFIVKLPKKRKS
ncbi:MAG: PAS domain S-box protein [Desulfobacteraceae bacterium]|nr:MAG: PAS domain S-box protein [Desulfobacteraceae bacterium]